jgi:hypothetical protein
MEVLVFTTTVETNDEVRMLAPHINSLVGEGNWNFALDDSDKILRIISSIEANEVIDSLRHLGYQCQELKDEITTKEIIRL